MSALVIRTRISVLTPISRLAHAADTERSNCTQMLNKADTLTAYACRGGIQTINETLSEMHTRFRDTLRTKSLRFWVTLGMLFALAPIALSAGGGYVLLNHGVIAPFQDVAERQRDQIAPAQNLRLLIWDSLIPVDEYLQDSDPVHTDTYRNIRGQVEVAFSELISALDGTPQARGLVERARDNWTVADQHATELLSVVGLPGDRHVIETQQRFHGRVVTTTDLLAATYTQISQAIMDDHDMANRSYERSMWLAGIAGGLSLLSIAFGVVMIGRVLSQSVDRLVDGAIRFADGDRLHRINVSVPPELHRVAVEFNLMIGRIQASEEALAELALQDSLTGLANRRAFDGALDDMWSRHQRFGEPGALLAIDLDHFKQVNDTYGHAAGDEVLRSVASVMRHCLRPSDKVFRVGGEEFSVLLPRTGLSQAHETAERLRRAIGAKAVQSNGNIITPTASIGLAVM